MIFLFTGFEQKHVSDHPPPSYQKVFLLGLNIMAWLSQE